jgi:hypothetical protein
MPNSKRISIKPLPTPQDDLVKPECEVVSGSVDVEQKSPTAPATGLRRARWPWAWLAVTGVVTLGWLIGIGWAAVEFVRWLWG